MRTIHLAKIPNKPHVMKTTLMFIEDNKICDGCDTHSVKCICLSLVTGGTSHLCQDCVEGMLESLDESIIRDRKINQIIG
jgi:hypothetical protein